MRKLLNFSNIGLLLFMTGLGIYNLFTSFWNILLFPNLIFLFFSITAVGTFLSLKKMSSSPTPFYSSFLLMGFINTCFQFASYYFINWMELLWNISFLISLIIILAGIIIHLNEYQYLYFKRIVQFLLIISGIGFSYLLLFKVDELYLHKIVLISFLISCFSTFLLYTFDLGYNIYINKYKSRNQINEEASN
jgi:hypothetical protein